MLEPLRHVTSRSGFKGIYFRRTSVQIRDGGGLWDESVQLWSNVDGARPTESTLTWDFGNNNNIKFSHLEYEKDKIQHQGKQYAFIAFDELTHFTESQFFYLVSRNRSVCGCKPYIRATCNPDPDSWVATFIEWWIDQQTGLPIPERNGVVRWFTRDGNKLVWADTLDECYEQVKDGIDTMIAEAHKKGNTAITKETFIKSATFVGGSIYDNKELLAVNPQYLGNLASLPEEERKQLLDGNWKARLSGTELYNYHKFEMMPSLNCRNGQKSITADIALQGSDLFVIGLWDGNHLEDVIITPKSDGAEVVTAILTLMKLHNVPADRVVYDADGVGGFIEGFIDGARAFHNGASPEENENYQNLKTQCFYKSAASVNAGLYSISEQAMMRTFNRKGSEVRFWEEFKREQRVIKRDKVDHDGKLKIIPKDKMKEFNGGLSPDLMDMFMMKEFLNLAPTRELHFIN